MHPDSTDQNQLLINTIKVLDKQPATDLDEECLPEFVKNRTGLNSIKCYKFVLLHTVGYHAESSAMPMEGRATTIEWLQIVKAI